MEINRISKAVHNHIFQVQLLVQAIVTKRYEMAIVSALFDLHECVCYETFRSRRFSQRFLILAVESRTETRPFRMGYMTVKAHHPIASLTISSVPLLYLKTTPEHSIERHWASFNVLLSSISLY